MSNGTTSEQALARWRRRIERNREQIERLREQQAPPDFYAPRARQFAAGAGLPSPELPRLLEYARPDDTWLDIGAGGGRFAVPLAKVVRRLVAIEPSPAMREVLAGSVAAASLSNVEIIDLRWPPGDGVDVPDGDVALAAHMLYDQDDAAAFIGAMERRAARLCIALLTDRAPSSPDPAIWRELHGEEAAMLPAAPEFIDLLRALGRTPDVTTVALEGWPALPLDDAHAMSRRLYWLAEGSEKDNRYRQMLARFAGGDGTVRVPSRPSTSSVVAWAPKPRRNERAPAGD